jgi:lipoprotein-releasing system permease protein
VYKLLLCWRYLRTRYIALASVISVTLGVATMIVVNSVMAGFSREMQARIHGILSDVVFEAHSMEGFPDPERRMAEIREVAGEYIEGMTATVHVPAMLTLQVNGQSVPRPVTLIGIDDRTHSGVSDFGKYLQHPKNREQMSFGLHESGYDVFDHQAEKSLERADMKRAGWPHRRMKAEFDKARREAEAREAAAAPPGNLVLPQAGQDGAAGEAAGSEPHGLAEATPPAGDDPFAQHAPVDDQAEFDAAKEQHAGIVVGIALCSFRNRRGVDQFLGVPGDDVIVSYPTAGMPPKIESSMFTIVDLYESKMSEYDSNMVFVPIRKLQELRGMIGPANPAGNVSAIQIKLKPGVDGNLVRDLLRDRFDQAFFGIWTWRDKQGPLLAAVQMETAILNILLFLIIAVAGFGILAIFFMIVVEKTRDIGILKSLGAPGGGVMSIFLTYGLSLGFVGSGVGMVLGLLFVININEIADLLGKITGRPVFDPSIYYFQKIPTDIVPFTVAWIVAGAMAIAVLASILPARRAARLHPVEALRYE